MRPNGGGTMKDQEKPNAWGEGSVHSYSLSYGQSSPFPTPRVVSSCTLLALYARYNGILWEEGFHKYNVSAFIREIHEVVEGVAFSVFSQDLLDQVIGALRNRGNSNATINRKLAALSKLLRKAHKMGDIHSLPEFRRQKERAGRIRFLEKNEEILLFSAIAQRSGEYFNLSVFLVDTGCRLGEALKLRWGDIQDGRVTFWITKSGKSRSIPLTSRAQQAVDVQKSIPIGPFTSIKPHLYRAAWNEAKAEIGLGDDRDVVPHVLRHTCASRLVRGGIDLRRVQTWLGHQTLTMTMRYAHLATHDLDMCIPILER